MADPREPADPPTPAADGPHHPVLRVNRLHYPVTVLGYGRRLGVWLQGCPLACPGCMSRDTWDDHAGTPIPVDELVEVWRQALGDGADGITVSGGEPLAQAASLRIFLDAVDATRAIATPADVPGVGTDTTPHRADILVYTGYETSELAAQQLAALSTADAVITGRYHAGEPTTLVWRGSANQVLTPLTTLGRQRYAEAVNRRTERPGLQLDLDADGVLRVVGVPRAGDLARLGQTLRAEGIQIGRPSWRP